MKRITCKLAVLIFAVMLIQNSVFTNQAYGHGIYLSGSATDFDWIYDGSTNGLFGDPCLVGGNTFTFSPSGFTATSDYPNTVYAEDTLTFELTAHDGLSFQSVSIDEWADYTIFGSGQVAMSGLLAITNLDTSAIYFTLLTPDQGMPIIGSDISGLCNANGQINLPLDWTHISVSLQNNLSAGAYDDESLATIQKKELGTLIAIQMLPEPATICLMAFGSLVFIGKKK